MTKLFDDGKIMIDFNSVLAFYFDTRYQSYYSVEGIKNPRIKELVILIGSKYNEPQELKFDYSEIDYELKDKTLFDKDVNFKIGKQIHDELLNYFKNDN